MGSHGPCFGRGHLRVLTWAQGVCRVGGMEKTTAGKVNDNHIGEYIELYIPRNNGPLPVGGGCGKLINYQKRGNAIDFIFAGRFTPITVRQTDTMQVFNYETDGSIS